MKVATQKFQMQSLLNTHNYHWPTQRANPIQSQYMFGHSSLNLDVLKFSSAASLANNHLLVKWLVRKCHTVDVQNSMHNQWWFWFKRSWFMTPSSTKQLQCLKWKDVASIEIRNAEEGIALRNLLLQVQTSDDKTSLTTEPRKTNPVFREDFKQFCERGVRGKWVVKIHHLGSYQPHISCGWWQCQMFPQLFQRHCPFQWQCSCQSK